MDAVFVTIELPAELVERAKSVGLSIDGENPQIVEAIEAQVRRLEAGRDLRQIMDQVQALPDNLKPSLQEIEDEIQAVRAEMANERAPKVPE